MKTNCLDFTLRAVNSVELKKVLHSLQEFIFFRLLPKNATHSDVKRHVKVVPFKVSRLQNNLRKKHVNCHFAMAFVKHARELSFLFSDEDVFFLSADDKARVPLGLPVSINKPRF